MRRAASFLLATLSLAVLAYGGLRLIDANPSPSPAPPETTTNEVRPVNAVLGNSSFRTVFGTAPTPDTPEHLRLQTHLAYVEALLRARPRPFLSDGQQARRTQLLDALHEYWTAGRFPHNTEVPGRSPVFIDEQGRLCAVGHLIATSAGRALAERIDAQYHLANVRSMTLPAIDQWAERNGFTRRELAMIQPMYCGGNVGSFSPCPQSDDEDASALEVTALSVSASASVLNAVLLEKDNPSFVGGAFGVVGGATSLTTVLRDEAAYPTVSSVAGATSVVLGTWSIVNVFRQSESRTSSTSTPSSSQQWSIAPTSIRTVDGASRPGLRATIEF